MSSPAAPLTALELATGTVFGDTGARDIDARPPTVAAALDAILTPALEREPCVVSFSGGRDSSLLLAAAVRAARRSGAPAPVPVTYRFAGRPEASEDSWQELVVAHLGLRDWERIEVGDELDLVGPLALDLRRRLGMLFPPNAHLHAPMLALARGGSIITGAGGDELLGGWRGERAMAILSARRRPTRGDLRALLRHVGARRDTPLPWLTPAAARAYARERGSMREPLRWAPSVRWRARRRWRALTRASLAAVAATASVEMCQPLSEPSFAAALAAAGGRRGLGDRTATMRALFADILPPAILERRGKARFDGAYWGPASRALAARWTGDGLGASGELVVPERLRSCWLAPVPDARSALLLQVAALASERPRREGD